MEKSESALGAFQFDVNCIPGYFTKAFIRIAACVIDPMVHYLQQWLSIEQADNLFGIEQIWMEIKGKLMWSIPSSIRQCHTKATETH